MAAKRTKTKKNQASKRGQKGPSPNQRKHDRRLRKLERLLADMSAHPDLPFAVAARKWGLDRRWARIQLGSKLYMDSSGHLRVTRRDRRQRILYIPTATPGVRTPLATRNKQERKKVGRWITAVYAARDGDFFKLKKLPRRLVVGGVRLETSPERVQAILNALAEEESPFEGLYRAIVSRS